MKQLGSIYFTFLLVFVATAIWGQTPDSTQQNAADTLRYRTVISNRIDDPEMQERAPSLSKLMKRADEQYGKKNYFAAMKYYGFVLNAEPLKVEALMGYGESAVEIASLDSAESAFQRMVDRNISPSPDYFPKMRLAAVKFRKGQYNEAAELYNEVATVPQTPAIPDDVKNKAAEQYELCLWAQGVGLDNPYIVKNDEAIQLDTANINTNELYSEYVATVRDNQLYFSAYRFDMKKDRAKPKRNAIKLLQAAGADGQLGPNRPMVVTETVYNDIKRTHTAHLSFNQVGDVAYYSLGDYVRDSADIRFDLYRKNKETDGTWGEAEKLNAVNMDGYTTTEPSVGLLVGSKYETLFFVSDRPGGKGQRDIWYSTIIGDSLTRPFPLKYINTPGDDVTPFYHNISNTLFFSTDSLKSLGGFDVYKSKPLKQGKWSEPQHLGAPINSSANDVFFVLDKESRRGFFSSNRIGGTNYSEEGCCYDIYAVDFVKQYRAIALHDLTHKPLPYAQISLYEQGTDGKYTRISAPAPDSLSSFNFVVNLNKNYLVMGEKAGFRPDTVARLTPDELWTSELVDTLYLRPFVNLIASVYDSETLEPILGATATFFQLGEQNKAGQFVRNFANEQVDILPDDAYQKTYPLDFQRKYQVLAFKQGYVAATSLADSSEVISTIGRVDGGNFEVKLYLHKPSPLEEYLPITLYFDNDYPKRIRSTDDQLAKVTDPYLLEMRRALAINPRDKSYHDTILIDYQKTFVGYMRKKEEFKTGTSVGMTGTERQNSIDTIENFFEDEVRYNWTRFFELSDLIDAMLQEGDTIILTLKGYASPLSNPDYNQHLANRRIASVYNHFMIFDGGIFQKYREGRSGQLKFIREANGDTESVKMGVSGDPKDRQHSVYGVEASRSRRVQVIGAKVSKGSNEQKKL